MRALLLPVLCFLAALALFAPGAYAGLAKGQERHATLRLVAETTTVKPGQTFPVAIDQTLTKGWHTYWKNPGDSGTPMIVRWTLPPGFSALTLHWPVPHPVPYGPLMNYGYEGSATLIQDIQAPDPLPP
ncbi:MAG TPA: protein-disulfide reductase DsbD family protein, partial [Alphaproteobacteria bacterium]|nr:protein-disulfide reductase DsbD family protein [Alphaproteobacteria bacterium]